MFGLGIKNGQGKIEEDLKVLDHIVAFGAGQRGEQNTPEETVHCRRKTCHFAPQSNLVFQLF